MNWKREGSGFTADRGLMTDYHTDPYHTRTIHPQGVWGVKKASEVCGREEE